MIKQELEHRVGVVPCHIGAPHEKHTASRAMCYLLTMW